MSVQFVIDASSFQGNVNWVRADSSTSFGWEKVTQGSRGTASRGYVNPFWAGPSGNNKRAMAQRAAASGFVPGGYLFLGHSESISKMPVKFQAIVLSDCILFRKPTAEELQKPELVAEGRA